MVMLYNNREKRLFNLLEPEFVFLILAHPVYKCE